MPPSILLALPKGRIEAGVRQLLADAGIEVQAGDRHYRAGLNLPGFSAKLLKPQNIVEMLHAGSRHLGFAGADWTAELGAELVELLDTGLNPVRVVVAGPEELVADGRLPSRPLVVASEYENLASAWVQRRQLTARVLRSYGATEVFPPEDADLIVDNTATGSTLAANRLRVVDVIMESSTRLYAHPRALEDAARREAIDAFVVLLDSVLEARRRVLVELNVPGEHLDAVIRILPCMRQATVSPLQGNGAYGVKAALPRERLPLLIPEIKRRGGSDILVSGISQIVP